MQTIKFFLLVFLAVLSTYNHAAETSKKKQEPIRGKETSIYNVFNGTLLYTYWDSHSNPYVSAKSAGSFGYGNYNRANWTINYTFDGYVFFRSAQNSDKCLTFYSSGDRPTYTKCDVRSHKQHFKLIPSEFGGILIKHRDEDLYLNANGSGRDYIVSSPCDSCGKTSEYTSSTYFWAFVPPLRGSKTTIIHDEL